MAGYILFENLEITDQDRLNEYISRVPAVVEQYGGRYTVLGGEPQTAEGEWKPNFLVLLEFPTVDQARTWYDSPEYRELRAIRDQSGRFNAVFIDGLVPAA